MTGRLRDRRARSAAELMPIHVPTAPPNVVVQKLIAMGVESAECPNIVHTSYCDKPANYHLHATRYDTSNTSKQSKFPASSQKVMIVNGNRKHKRALTMKKSKSDTKLTFNTYQRDQGHEPEVTLVGSMLKFITGKSLVTGIGKPGLALWVALKSVEDAYRDLNITNNLFWIRQFGISNIVIHGRFIHDLDLEKLIRDNVWMSCSERYPSVVCGKDAQPDFRCTVSLYQHGTFVAGGSRHLRDFTDTMQLLIPVIESAFIPRKKGLVDKDALREIDEFGQTVDNRVSVSTTILAADRHDCP